MLKSYRHLQHLQPAEAAVQIARYHGYCNVFACDDSNIEVDCGIFVATFGVVWLDTCGNEDGGLALTDMQICEHVDNSTEFIATGIWELNHNARKLANFIDLFIY